MNWTDVKCGVLCLLVVVSAFGAGTNSNTLPNQQNTLTSLANSINTLQRQASGSRYGAGEDAIRLGFAGDNFSAVGDRTFRYRAVFSKQGKPLEIIDKTVDFSTVASIYPLPVSADGTGAIAVDFSGPEPGRLLFYYPDKGVADGKLMNALLDLIHAVNKAKGEDLDGLYADWKELVQRAGTHESISQFIAKHPDSFLRDFARMVRDSKQRQKD
ncbi:hypothetical protein ACMGDE_17665 [Parapedobacter sp. DT-150]